MAKTTVLTADNLTKKAWEEKILREARIDAYFERFMGDSADSIVQVKRQLEKQKGDAIKFGLRMKLTGAGKTSGQQLEGNEEKLTTYDDDVTLEEYCHAVRDNGPLDRQRPVWDIDTESKDALTVWGSEKIDSLCFTALLASPTKIFYRNSSGVVTTTAVEATAKSGLDGTNSVLNLTLLNTLKTWAKTGGGRSYIPIRPVKVEGKEYHILLCHPDCLYDLKETTAFQQAMREAEVRGKENPLFTGATAIWQGVIIHEHENCTAATDGGGGSVAWAKAAFIGAQALCFAWGKRGELVAETFDYKREHGYAWSVICGVTKPVFNSKDYGSVGVYLARTNVSGL